MYTCSLTNSMAMDFYQTKSNLKISRKKPIPGAKDALAIPAGICHKLLRKPGQNLNKDGMTSLHLN